MKFIKDTVGSPSNAVKGLFELVRDKDWRVRLIGWILILFGIFAWTGIFLVLTQKAKADCVIWKMVPMAPDSKGCVGWNWVFTPVSETNCKPIQMPSNPIARFNPDLDPNDCVFFNHSGRSVNLCR